jgi:GNAT superfamily N-acetyltransferase
VPSAGGLRNLAIGSIVAWLAQLSVDACPPAVDGSDTAVCERGALMRSLLRNHPPPGEQIRLPFGHTIVVRPIEASDGALLLDGFARLSDESRRLRFLGGKATLTAHDVRYFTEVDHRHHEAVVALDLAGRGVGVARFVQHGERAGAAEVAIVVVDEWHRRGVGRTLIKRLAQRADEEGVTCFTALMADDNTAVVGLLRSAGARMAVTGVGAGAIRFGVAVAALLDDPERADHLVPTAVPAPCFA